MNNHLENGYKITLRGKEYAIQKIIGRGSSCVVYKADSTDGSNVEVLLKEYNPKYLGLRREKDGTIICPEEKREAYEKGLTRFKSAAKIQADFRKNVDSLKNPTANIQDIVNNVNGTCYIIMSVLGGKNYSEYEDKTLEELLTRIRSIAKVIGSYHDEGYLHLDIKPDNIFVLQEAEKLPILFDFDSIIKKSELQRKLISYTESWAAPEQLSPYNSDKICESTDLYAIGEMLFYKLMGRHSEHCERRSFSKFEFDAENTLLKNINPKIFKVLTEIFNHTICNSVARRYKTANELIEKLDEAIKLSNPEQPFLQHFPISVQTFFVGRDNELMQIEKELQDTDRLYISGIGGIGKSELAKQFAAKHKNDYDAIIFAICSTDIKSMICGISICNVEDQLFEEKLDDCVNRKLHALQNIGRENKILLIIDNFNIELENEDDAKLFNRLIACTAKTLITTRNNITEDDGKVLELNSVENARIIFDNYYKGNLSENDSLLVDQIIEIYQNHTLATELLAKQMVASRVTPNDMLQKLRSGGLKNSGGEKIKVGTGIKQNAYSCIQALFNISVLKEDERYILLNLSLIPPTGIRTEVFHDWCGLNNYDDINSLKDSGWIKHDEANDIISLHPIIADIALDELEKDITNCEPMLNAITETFNNGDFANSDSAWKLSLFHINTAISNKLCRIYNLTELCINFINETAMKFYQYGHTDEYIDCVNHAINASECIPEFPKEKSASLFYTLGSLYLSVDKLPDAEESVKKSLYMNYELYGKEQHGEIATTLILLGYVYYRKNQLNDAKQCWDKALEMPVHLYNKHNVEIAQLYNCMGLYYDVIGNFEVSEKLLKIAKEIYSSLGENKYSSCVTIYNNLGGLYTKYGYYDKAEEHLRYALLLSKSIHGENHHDTAKALYYLGKLYLKIENHKDAEINYQKSLDTMLKIQGENRILTATIYNNLAWLALYIDNFEKAEKLYLKSKDIFLDVYEQNENHAEIATVYDNLGVVYERQSNIEKAIKHLEKALKIRKILFATDHPDIKILENRIKKLQPN